MIYELIESAFKAVCEAEAIQAAGSKDGTYWCLIRAHSELLKARNLERAKEARLESARLDSEEGEEARLNA